MLILAASASLSAQNPSQVLGRISFPTSGSPAAQPSFVRGVLLLHSFEYDDAIAAFKDAQRIDPAFAMAYWGEAMCYNQTLWYNENLEKARAVLARLAPTRAARQAKAPSPREKGYLDAVERLFGEGAKAARDRAYADRMGELSRQFPDDDEAAAFYALSLLATIPSGQRDTTISLKAGGIAAAILKKNPEHPGAAHYALHAFDDGEHAAMGLEAARIYARIAPASSHARHMPSHVFLPLGMWDEAAASDESAFAASVERVKRLGLTMAQAEYTR
jgi:tetratricopeptide (TPR) repeat protein